MKLKDEQGNEYEFEWESEGLGYEPTKGTLKPLDTWPKEGDKYYTIQDDAKVNFYMWSNDKYDNAWRELFGIYRTRESAELAAERIRSLQEIHMDEWHPLENGGCRIIASFPKAYYKAWKDLAVKKALEKGQSLLEDTE